MAIYTLFDDVTAPTGLSTRTTTGITVGNAVTTTVAGGVTAIQFYKAALDTGTHIGMLWTTPDQALLAQVTFTGESASGWQTQAFPTPVALAAGTTFTVGIHHLNYNSDYPLAAPVTSGPLTMGTTEFWGTAAVPGYPTPGTVANMCAAVDVVFDDTVPPPTAFIAPAPPPGTVQTGSGGPFNLGQDIVISTAGIRIRGAYYWKVAGDTVTNRVATLYRTSDQAVMGTATFSGETASGWQYVAFGSPIVLANGSTYRLAVHTGANYGFVSPFAGVTRSDASLSSTGSWGQAGGIMAYPPNNATTTFYGPDALLDAGAAPTALRASQVLDEAWVTSSPKLSASQLLAEVWTKNQPPTALQASQLLAEVWTTDVPIALIASQDLAEVWLRPGVAVGYRRHNVSAHVTRSP